MTTLWETENSRLVLRYDDWYNGEPYDDGSTPIVAAETSRFYNDGLRMVKQITTITSYRLPEDIVAALAYYGREYNVDRAEYLWARYLRLWHDNGDNVPAMVRDECRYYAIAPKHWREQMGLTDEYLASHPDVRNTFPNFGEYKDYLVGDVYYATLEEKVTWTAPDGRTKETWEPIDSIAGLYGDDAPADALGYFPAPEGAVAA